MWPQEQIWLLKERRILRRVCLFEMGGLSIRCSYSETDNLWGKSDCSERWVLCEAGLIVLRGHCCYNGFWRKFWMDNIQITLVLALVTLPQIHSYMTAVLFLWMSPAKHLFRHSYWRTVKPSHKDHSEYVVIQQHIGLLNRWSVTAIQVTSRKCTKYYPHWVITCGLWMIFLL